VQSVELATKASTSADLGAVLVPWQDHSATDATRWFNVQLLGSASNELPVEAKSILL
jgi:hypothetical protein